MKVEFAGVVQYEATLWVGPVGGVGETVEYGQHSTGSHLKDTAETTCAAVFGRAVQIPVRALNQRLHKRSAAVLPVEVHQSPECWVS